MFSMLLESGAAAPDATNAATGGSLVMTVIMLVFWVGVMWFVLIRPQKKQQKEMDALRNSIEPGDNIMTTGGFYGVVLDVYDDTVIVEFGNNKNCRIPMHKNAIAEVEKDEEETESDKK
ncbi:MAG: preprotein translocase subunit YajC [Lachnospiraceae bacterium]|nr:preprotein translocase subunit YajC [Lachnospiraceae bacterium]MDE6627198.1 preprotein translocase subunit YajC [Lachnospiraceae bacterium]